MAPVVSIWGGGDSLPSLEPTSLYVLALVQLAFGAGQAAGPPPFGSPDTVPSLYVDGKVVASTPDEALAYCTANSELDGQLDGEAAARAVAIHALLDDRVRDLVLHTLFSLPANFEKVAPWLAPRTVPPSSLPRRLRNAVRARLESPHIRLWGAGGSWARAEAAEAQRWNAGAGLAPQSGTGLAAYTPGILQNKSRALDVREEWERSRLRADARSLFRVLDAFLADTYMLGQQPSSVDAHLYAVLAPVLHGPQLPVALLAELLTSEFPRLVEHNERLHQLLWHDRWAFERVANPAPSPVPDMRAVISETWKSLWTRAPKEAAPPAPLSLRIGRAVWITSAIVGAIAWIFASGIVTIEYIDEDDEDDEEYGEDENAFVADQEDELDEEGEDGYEDDEDGIDGVFGGNDAGGAGPYADDGDDDDNDEGYGEHDDDYYDQAALNAAAALGTMDLDDMDD
ncbi:hypothetical protein MCUN1_001148 [Malassezia cuniculi]|uniref:Metaxin glutathione S-transferase domain-containing protein n=1 Tax=Malassezia cuniculi TaxID=948313 RepID=A0AAF0ET88_9BASI|nr:hypothetical protein MCUN1_001148 [Malassezia cuniculi]